MNMRESWLAKISFTLSFTLAIICAPAGAQAQGAPQAGARAATAPQPVRAARAPMETIVIAAEDDWAPYSFAKPSGGVDGLAPALVAAVFETQNIAVKFVVVPFARCLLMAQTGSAAGCFDASITDENRAQFYWHPTPLFQEELAIFARQDASDAEVKLEQVEGHSLGLTIGYTYPASVMGNTRIRKVNVGSDANLLNMLVAGRVDYILLNTLPGYYRASQDRQLVGRVKRVGLVQLDGFWVAFSRAHPEGKRLSEIFETGLQQIKADGTYARITADFRRRLNLPTR
ncbi:transporter substrate-binding domain-containing protein [soil metagenome]